MVLPQGFTANLVRNSVISATEIVTYDVSKQALLHRAGMEEGLLTHFAAAMTAGEGDAVVCILDSMCCIQSAGAVAKR